MNTDQKRRDEIMNLTDASYVGGLEKFDELLPDQLELLIKENFISATDTYGASPTAQEFLDFLKAHDEFYALGHVISSTRDDYKVVIEGLQAYGKISKELKDEFEKFAATADDMVVDKDELYCLWQKKK